MVIGSRPYSKRFRIIGLPHGFTTAVTACIVLIAASVALLAGCTGVVNTTTTTGNTGTGSGAATAPVITTQPVSQSVGVGQTVNFVVVATGSAPLSYQWQKNGVNISGATSNSYTTPAAATGDNAARFIVVVSNSTGSATSNAAILTVTSAQQGNTAPQIITQPTSQTVTAGQSATFTVVASGSPTLTYQWQKNGANIAGATSASYTTPATATSDSGSTFDVIVRNSFGTVTSNAASLTVNPSTGSNPPPPPPPSGSSTDVTTYHYDNLRTGQNTHETVLTHANVNSSTFGLLGSFPVDGHVDAQPLYLSAVAIPGQGTKNVLYVVTEHDSVYAFDADSVSGNTATTLWHSSVLAAGETSSDDRGCGQVTPEIGITSTPVIDRTRNAIYLVAVSKTSGGSYVHRFHALNLTTGAELFGGPTTITATYPGTGANSSNGNVVFDPSQYNERPGLLQVGGTIFTTWGSHCDAGPYTSWVMAYSADTLHQTGVINMVPNGDEGGIWMAGAAPGADASGNIYFIIGNGDFGTTLDSNGFPTNKNCGNCFAKISSTLPLALTDYFTPLNTVSESNADTDFGSGGPLLLPDVTDSNGQTRHLAVGAGKDQIIYVVDRDNMGKFNSTQDNIYQQINGALSGGVWSKPSYFNGVVYYGAVGDSIKAFPISAGKLATTASSKSSHTFGYPGATPAISANGTSDGIVWVVENSNNGVLHAYDATNLATELYNSTQGSNGQFSANKFITPMIANGKVYIGTQTSVVAFGLK
jgi:Ig-like domain-containing protein/immunoglobulin I-set domain protein